MFNPEDYYICYKWEASFDYTQERRRGGSTTKPRVYTQIKRVVTAFNKRQAEFSLNAEMKKKRRAKITAIHCQ